MLPAMRFHRITLAVCLLATGCASPASLRNDIQASIRKCGLEGQLRVEVVDEHVARIRYLHPKADYTKMDCFLAEARRLRLDLGFVGNEATSNAGRN